MKILNNKIAFLIPEARQIDYYENIIRNMDIRSYVLIVNDKNKSEILKIRSVLDQRGYPYKNISECLEKNEFYKVLVSTGNFRINRPFFSIGYLTRFFNELIKYLYAKTFGITLELLKIDRVLIRYIRRPFTAGGKLKRFNIRAPKWIERSIGETTVLFPRGLDIDVETFPPQSLVKRFDIFFCHSLIEEKLIHKCSDRKTVLIGYPRYTPLPKKNEARESLINEFQLNPNLPIYLWIPSRLDVLNSTAKNILDWTPTVSSLKEDANLLIRPHPHLIDEHPGLCSFLNDNGFKVDDVKHRSLGGLYSGVDLVFCDYGGSVYSAIYCMKPVIILKEKTGECLKKEGYFYAEVVKYLTEFEQSNTKDLKEFSNNIILKKDISDASLQDIKSKVFGDVNFNDVSIARDFLIQLLRGNKK